MYAELNVLLRSGVNSASIRQQLAKYLGNTAISANDAVENTSLAAYHGLVVGAAAFPSDSKVIYLCLVENEVQVYIFAKTISQIKEHCAKAVKQLKKMHGLEIKKSSATILIPDNGTDIDILIGDERGWFSTFTSALFERWFSKGLTAAVNATGAVIIFKAAENPAISAVIGLIATAVGIVFESLHSAWRVESWSWKESK
ncbi:hypothetical protein ACIQAL_09330 [Pseudomonas sp. NPDC088368]|uniref:hypothetical protein n=1 Tax=Pseudomonas sp. NPDC088368 TaxID=3364453 RepID=UPI00381F78C0